MENQSQESSNQLHQNENQPLTKKERRELKREEKQAAQVQTKKSRSMKRIILWIGAIMVLGGIVGAIAKFGGNNTGNESGGILSLAVSEADHIRGNSESPVTLIEYGDLQCPACAQYHPLVIALEKEFGDEVRFVFRHFPLGRIHPNAEEAAHAAEAAGMQGKFWEMHDILFERQAEWSSKPRPKSTFTEYGKELGLDINKFEDDIDSDTAEKTVDQHYQSGVASGVNATPTFFLNEVKLRSPGSYEEFRTLLISALEEARQIKNGSSMKQEESSYATSTENQ